MTSDPSHSPHAALSDPRERVREETLRREVVGIVGAGAMGAGIAQVALQGGLQVVLYDAAEGAVARARDSIIGRLERLASKGELTDLEAAKQNLQLATGLADLGRATVVVEAIVEDLDAKRKLIEALEPDLADDAIFASNTSSIPIGALAQAAKHRGRVAGLHFFNPVPLMKLVEVVAAPDTEPSVTARLMALGRAMGRTPVLVKDGPGFLVNLGGRAYITEALHLLQERVAEPSEIDAIMRDCCGFRMGPFELMDLTGLDVNYPTSRIIYAGFQDDPRLKTTSLHEAMFRSGRLGRKTGQGFHRYDAAGKRLEQGGSPAHVGETPARLICPEAVPSLVNLLGGAGAEIQAHDDGTSPIVVALLGEDATTAAVRLGLDPRRTVAIDTAFDTSRRVTIMAPPGPDRAAVAAVAMTLGRGGRAVSVIGDSPGFVTQRLVAMIANLGCEMAQQGVAEPADIDLAMRLGLNYPKGPLEWADQWGLERVHATLQALQSITGSDRYRPSLWLRRRCLLRLGAHAPG